MSFITSVYAKKLFDSQIPKFIKTVERIAAALEKQNELKEKELENMNMNK